MNMPNRYSQEQEFEYQLGDQRGGKEKEPRQRRAQYSRANRPAVHNGIHRRRNKRFAW
jgi:hypothetical protein